MVAQFSFTPVLNQCEDAPLMKFVGTAAPSEPHWREIDVVQIAAQPCTCKSLGSRQSDNRFHIWPNH
jgi:hypothetical protein